MCMVDVSKFLFFFFFNDTATTEIYTLSLHDALPISVVPWPRHCRFCATRVAARDSAIDRAGIREDRGSQPQRSEEHTSELQSPCNLVCRLLLEKKKKIQSNSRTSLGTMMGSSHKHGI